MGKEVTEKPYDSIRYKIVETLCIIDDAKRFGWTEDEYKKIGDKLLDVITMINYTNPKHREEVQ